MNVDQAGFNPPERPGWKFPGPYLHWDVSLAQPVPFGVQGILYLADTAADQGAFHVRAWLSPADRTVAWDWLPDGTDPREADSGGSACPLPAVRAIW